MNDETSGAPSWLPILFPLAIVGIILLLRKSRSQSRVDKAMQPIGKAIDDSGLPDNAKSILLNAIDEVRDALNNVSAAAEDIKKR
ncbi:MAG: hypothetical protein M9890_13415 [Thermomicrobiales bacterium]|nr:hypothetical protein [Thermomicrobiales bacterium]